MLRPRRSAPLSILGLSVLLAAGVLPQQGAEDRHLPVCRDPTPLGAAADGSTALDPYTGRAVGPELERVLELPTRRLSP